MSRLSQGGAGCLDAAMAALSLGPPRLFVVVDTEEEFDWTKPFSRSATGVEHVKHQTRAQSIFERFAIRPTYVVDYPIATQERGFGPLREWLADGRCDIGAHLHPWVNPPFAEEVSVRNSYPGNLPATLEREKLARLTDAIEANFAERPTIYRAGRYGIGPATGAILEELGYEIDTSVVPRTDFRDDGGPDFREHAGDPFWFGPSLRVLEVPLTVGWYGRMARHQARVQPLLKSTLGHRLHLAGVLARLGLLERIRLSPEGITFAELKRLTNVLIRRGKRLFSLTYHSPSLMPGNTPYVRSEADLRQFLDIVERYCAFFFEECRGVASSLADVRMLLLGHKASGSPGDL
jgi:hypothetical protein